eukprot:gene11209-12503_t
MERAFRHLPQAELERLGLDHLLAAPLPHDSGDTVGSVGKIRPGSPEAQQLVTAWRSRQEELRTIMASMVKPAEHMANLTRSLQEGVEGTKLVWQERVSVLEELESLLTDIDNARDFHTIGGWPVLVNQLLPQHNAGSDRSNIVEYHRVAAAAAWAVGTTIKNSYDYQLWLAEEVEVLGTGEDGISNDSKTTTTAWKVLTELLHETIQTTHSPPSGDAASPMKEGQHDVAVVLQKRLLYALSAGCRGNVDIQSLCLASSHCLTDLYTLLSAYPRKTDGEVMRKVLAWIRDQLEEKEYIQQELLPALAGNLFSSTTTTISSNQQANESDPTLTSSHDVHHHENEKVSISLLGEDGKVVDGCEGEVDCLSQREAQEAINSLSKMTFLADAFLKSDCLEAVGKVAEQMVLELVDHSLASVQEGEDGIAAITPAVKSKLRTMAASLTSALHILRSALVQYDEAKLGEGSWRGKVNDIVKQARLLQGDAYGDIIEALDAIPN